MTDPRQHISTSTHRLQRRAFISRFGKGAVAVAVLGPTFLAACSSDGEISDSPGDTNENTGTQPDNSSGGAGTTDTPSTEVPPNDSESSETFRWERVNMGFVSAYILARGNEITIVDTGTSGNLPVFDESLGAIGASWSDVNRIILTHAHGDHVGGLPEITDVATNAKVFIGEADLGGLDAEPVNDGDEIFGLQIIGTPGHTVGHISVLDPEAGFLVAGDALNQDKGLVLGPNPDFTSNMAEANASVQRLAERNFETIVFGHSEPIESGASDAVLAFAQTLS